MAKLVKELNVSVVREKSLKYENTSVNSFETAYQILKPIFAQFTDEKERAIALYLNIKNQVIAYNIISVGSISASIVHPREFFRGAIIAGASAIIFAHNHPSGNVNPSADDIETTKRMNKASDIIGIPVIDSFILSEDSYYSMKQHGDF